MICKARSLNEILRLASGTKNEIEGPGSVQGFDLLHDCRFGCNHTLSLFFGAIIALLSH